jgi:hypothetical protein
LCGRATRILTRTDERLRLDLGIIS